MRWVHLFLALLLAFVVLPAVVRGQETAEFYVADVVCTPSPQTTSATYNSAVSCPLTTAGKTTKASNRARNK